MEERGKVVVIDDSPIVRKLAELALEEEGFKVYSAEDGEEGLKVAEEVLPSVILVDFIMPRMSGYQFCKMVRESELLKDIPIILITGKGEEAGRKFIEKFGVADFFVKPFKSETLVEKVTAIVEAQRVLRPEIEEAPVFVAEEEPVAMETLHGLEAEVPQVQEAGVAAEAFISDIRELTEPAEAAEPYVLDIGELAEPEGVLAEAEPLVAGEPEGFGAELPEVQEASAVAEAAEPYVLDIGELAEPGEALMEVEPLVAVEPQGFEAEVPQLQEVGLTGETPGLAVEPLAFEMGMEPEEIGVGLAGSGEAVSPVATADIEETVDRVMGRYFTGEFPFLLQKSLADILKQSGVIKTSGISLSGELSDVSLSDVLQLIGTNRLTGKLFIYAPVMSSEIYFDGGSIVYASTSKQGRDHLPGKFSQKKVDVSRDVLKRIFMAPKDAGFPGAQAPGVEVDASTYEIVVMIRERVKEALASVMELRGGNFFFERMALPVNLSSLPVSIKTSDFLLEGARRIDEAALTDLFRDQAAAFLRIMTGGGIEGLNLTEDELEVIRLVDSNESLGTILTASGMEETKLKRILYTLTKAGIIRET